MLIPHKELQAILLEVDNNYLAKAKTSNNHREKKHNIVAYFTAKEIRKKITSKLIDKYKKS